VNDVDTVITHWLWAQPEENNMDAIPTNEAVPASVLVRSTMRYMVKLLNPLIRMAAGRRFVSMAGLVTHTGRRSGRRYTTPVGAHVSGSHCLVPLTFGTGSDWSKNVRAAGGGHLRWQGRDYDLSNPRVYLAADIQSLIKQTYRVPERLGFKMLGIKSFLYLHATAVSH